MLAPMETVWLFDLDNTLHNATPHIFPHINRSMTEYVMAQLGMEEAEASALREDYWKRYGATLLGLMRHHGTDPDHFLRHTHQFPDLPAMLRFEPALAHALRRLRGKKIVYTNGPADYAEGLLALMGIRKHFDAVFAIEHAGFAPKPGMASIRRLLRQFRLQPERCVMVEDTAENLRTARRLGMRTVLVSPKPAKPAWVDFKVRSVLELPRRQGFRSQNSGSS